MPCVEVLVQDPEIYLERLDIHLPCAVDPTRDAILDEAHRARVNHEVFFLSGPEALEEFNNRPLRYAGMLTDPVSLQRFRPDAESPKLEHGGRPYYFASATNLEAFRAQPARFADPDGEMKMR